MPRWIQPGLYEGVPTKKILGDGHDEHWHQTRFFTWVRATAELQSDPIKKSALEWLHSIPNGSYVHRTEGEHEKAKGKRRAPRQALKLIDEGLTAGVWDWRLDYVLRDSEGFINCPGLIGEMKMPGKYLSKEQREYGEYMSSQGFQKGVHRNWQQAAIAVIEYMQLNNYAPLGLLKRELPESLKPAA